MDSKQRQAWQRNYAKGFGGVTNVLHRMRRRGSEEMKAFARKTMQLDKAGQVAAVRALEEAGGLTEEYRVTDELSKGLGGVTYESYGEDIKHIQSIREKSFETIANYTLGTERAEKAKEGGV